MQPLNLVLWGLGIVVIVIGALRIRTPWSRYQALKAQEENIARYEGWRGTRLRDEGPSAATLMMQEARRQAQADVVIVIVGVVVVVAGFAIR